MPSPRRRAAAGCAVFLPLLAAGCEARTSTVTGTVTYQGKPLAGGSVVLFCADKQIARGLIGRDGAYAIPNVPTGPAVVTVQAHARAPAGMRKPQKLPPTVNGPTFPPADPGGADRGASIPPRYALPEESGLAVTVDRDRLTHDIDLKP